MRELPPSQPALQKRLALHVEQLAGVIGPRTLGRPKTIEATTRYLCSQWDEMGFAVVAEAFDALGDPAVNLVIESRGSSRPDEVVVLGAHYDTIPTTPGADDNASAVAVLLEVSRLLKDHVGRRTMRYVAFDEFRRGFKRGTRLPLFSIVLPQRVHEIRLSDNSSFWDQGYEALMLTDTKFLRNPHYHQRTDTPETLDYVRLAEVAEGVASALKRLLA